jgi:ATP-dependent protease HslVU (ClpYQ) peptidase subunit
MFWIYLIAGLIIGFAGYCFGYKNAENAFKAKLEEHVGEMLNEKIEQVKNLYEETYRNVLRTFVKVAKEEIKKDGQE